MTRPALAREVGPDEPIPLKEACERYLPSATPATLRAQDRRGRLEIFPLGKRLYSTRRSMEEMFVKCREERRDRVSTSIRTARIGLSETEKLSSVQAATQEMLKRLKGRSNPTSAESTSQNPPRRPRLMK